MSTLDRLTTALADRYRVSRELGAGGMATVYLAHDIRHERDVAIKVLHPDLGAALGAERFLSEIKTTARLQHPHILPLLDSGVADTLLYYVMPLVTGETLRARLERERQLPVDDAIRLAREVAAALEHAHKQGIIHRDIKPENILLQDGSALVADFGIALAVQQAGTQRLTQTGLSLGTPQYMSPEQAMGERVIDARSDQYALAAVTYEMLAGEPPFTGPSVQAIVARLMSEEPRSLSAQRRAIPDTVDDAIHRALEKLPADRFPSLADFAAALDDRTGNSGATRSARSGTSRADTRFSALNIVLGAVTGVALAVAAWSLTRPGPRPEVVRYRIVADSVSSEVTWSGDVSISPDGNLIMRRGGPGERVLVRQRDALDFAAIAGTEGAMGVAFSPDGKRIVFYQNGRLVVMPAAGGPPTIIADSMTSPESVAWASDDRIYRGADTGALVITRCPATDCRKPEPFSVLDSAAGEASHIHPVALPDASALLYQVEFSDGTRRIAIQRANASTHTILMDGIRVRIAPPEHLLYSTVDGKLWVVPFDAKGGRLTGEPRLVAENLRSSIVGPVDFALSESGTLVYSEERGLAMRELVWVTRDGRETHVDSTWRATFSAPVLSRDGGAIAVTVRDGARNSIWTKVGGAPAVKLTSERSSGEPAWSPDGGSVTYLAGAERSNSGSIWRQSVNGGDVARFMVRGDRPLSEQVWLPDGSGIVARTTTPTPGAGDLMITRALTDTLAVPLLATPRSEYSPAVSPDGRWLAFASNSSGRFEVYVAAMSAPSTTRMVISVGGATSPRWAANGSAVYFLSNTSQLMEARVSTTPSLRVEGIRPLFSTRDFVQISPSRRNYDVAPDGRFLFVRRAAGGPPMGSMVVVEHFTETLRSKAP